MADTSEPGGSRLSPLFGWRSAIVESELSSTQRLVALVLSLHMSERGDSCFPFVSTLVEESALGESTVRRELGILRDEGWLTVERGGQDGRRASTYTATIPTQIDVDQRPSPSETQGSRSEWSGVSEREVLEESAIEGAIEDPPGGELALAERIEEVMGELVDEVEVALADRPVSAQSLVAEFLEEVARRGAPRPPARYISQIARYTKELLDESIEPDRIRAGMEILIDKRLNPSLLANTVTEASLPSRPRTASSALRYGRGMTTRQMLDTIGGAS